MLQLRNILKVYRAGSKNIVALDHVSIDFPTVGMVFIVGKSGAGKSTLLNILGGLDKMDEGEIIINGRSTSNFKAKDFDNYRNYQVGFIFQEFNLIDDLSVKENIAIALKIQAKGHDATTIDEALKLVNLEGLGYRTPKELSGGQKQRIAIARALVKNPKIILADEPTGALDSKTGFELMSSLKNLSKDKLIVIVTHDNEMAYQFADEIIQINDGKIIDHLRIDSQYKAIENEYLTNKIVKITSGEKILNPEIINSILDEDSTNYLCLTKEPEILTIAHPEVYEKVFSKEDASLKFKGDNNKLLEIEKEKGKDEQKVSKIRLMECLRMAFHQFLLNKGKILFLLFFTILSTSLVGLTYTVESLDNHRIIANTLKNNNIELGMMGVYQNGSYQLIDKDDMNYLKNKYDDNQFAIAKEIEIDFTSSSMPTSSSFEMNNFTGVVETNNIANLYLNSIAGKAEFDENSLANHEIIISDYAAYELRRKGYLGLDNNQEYGVIRPSTLEEQINTAIKINNQYYTIVGVFDTNFEDYLSLLVSETYIDDKASQQSSLAALKSYYYARIFGPEGFYSTFIDENGIYKNKSVFSTYFSSLTLYEYNQELSLLTDNYSYVDIEYNGYSSFLSFSDFKEQGLDYEVVYGSTDLDNLEGNQVVLSYDFFRTNGFTQIEQIEKAIEQIENQTTFRKMKDSATVDTIIQNDPIEVVAVIDIEETNAEYDEIDYAYVAIYLSDDLKAKLNEALYGYDQILFTLKGSRNKYTKTIKNLAGEGYTIVNIDGGVSLNTSDIEAMQTIGLVASVIMLLFSFLMMMSFVSTNIKSRKKEMGILKATGAKGKDIIKIYAIEEGILAFIVAILSIFIDYYLIDLINTSFGNANLKIELLIYDFKTVALIIAFAFVFFTATTIIPILKIASYRPIDAIRKD